MGKKIKKAFSSVAKVATLGLSDSLLKEAPKPEVAAQQTGSAAPVQAADTTNLEEDRRRRRNQAGPVQGGAAAGVKAPLGSPTVLGG
jgi:hypothetical protein